MTSKLALLIVEDERLAARRLVRSVESALADYSLTVHIAEDIAAASKALADHPVDLVFLDLNLRGASGFSFLDMVATMAPLTIIVSAQADMALRAFEYGVLDFVAKPYSQDRLKMAIDRFEAQRAEPEVAQKYIGVRTRDGHRILKVADISHISAAGDYVTLHMIGGDDYLHDRSLDGFMATLPPCFHRIHRSHILNEAALKTLSAEPGSRYFVNLKDGRQLPVGRSRYQALKQRFGI